MAAGGSVVKACGLCGKTEKLTKTKCCNNWICDDEDQYQLFSYAKNSCNRNHQKETVCSSHSECFGHKGKWQDCEECKEILSLAVFVDMGTNDYNFEKLKDPPKVITKCANCGFESHSLKDFPLCTSNLKDGCRYFCKKDQCQRGGMR